jgi:hypothetical protein
MHLQGVVQCAIGTDAMQGGAWLRLRLRQVDVSVDGS